MDGLTGYRHLIRHVNSSCSRQLLSFNRNLLLQLHHMNISTCVQFLSSNLDGGGGGGCVNWNSFSRRLFSLKYLKREAGALFSLDFIRRQLFLINGKSIASQKVAVFGLFLFGAIFDQSHGRGKVVQAWRDLENQKSAIWPNSVWLYG